MDKFRKQLEREAGFDVRVAAVGLVAFFALMALAPRDWFWFYFVPLAGFWFRYLWVRNRRDEALLRAEVAAGGGCGTAGAYACDGGICISDGTHHILIARQDAKSPLDLPDIVGRKEPGNLARDPLIDNPMTARRAINKRRLD